MDHHPERWGHQLSANRTIPNSTLPISHTQYFKIIIEHQINISIDNQL